MLRELLEILRPGNPLEKMGDDFARMFAIALEMTKSAGRIYFREKRAEDSAEAIYARDIEVNKLERGIRKRVVSHLAVGPARDVPYCLLLMSLVKDVERIGDYAKNLAEVVELYAGEMPVNGVVADLRSIRNEVETFLGAAPDVFADSDRERAEALLPRARALAKRADELLPEIANAGYTSGQTTALVLACRYYKRFASHVANVISGVVMPLHKVDYYDEKELEDRDFGEEP